MHLKECLLRLAAEHRAELTRPNASPIEKLLVERVVACWLQLQYFSGVEANGLAGDASLKLLQYRAKRQAQAQRLYERAIAALVTVQKLFPVEKVDTVTLVDVPSGTIAEIQHDVRVPDVGIANEVTRQIDFHPDSMSCEPELEHLRVSISN